MTRPRRIWPFALALTVLAAIGWHVYATREPSYQGKSLFKWLNEVYHPQDEDPGDEAQARAAIRAIGKSCLPTLLRMVQAQDSALKMKLMAWAEKQSVVDFHFRPAYEIQYNAFIGFQVLGAEGKDAIPTLAVLLPNTNSGYFAAACLTATGPTGLPILRHGLTNLNPWVRICCLAGLNSNAKNGFATLPEILSCLHDSNWVVRREAVFGLRHFQHDSATVLPVIWQKAQQDQDVWVRITSIKAMSFFTNQASAYVQDLQRMLLNTNANALPLFEELTNALQNIDPAAWPNGGAPPPAGSPTNLSSVGPAFQPAGSGGFPAPSTSGGPESPPNRQPGKAALPDAASPRAVGQPVHGVQGIP